MKRGISLIAVLMFMLAATTASIVVFKWIGSENFASGARLKASEAYQASESGLDAVYAWLSYKAADAGAVIGDYLSKPQPISLTTTLGGDQGDKKYEVYLTEVGADKTNKIFKLKFLSVGIGRDNSRVVQEAVYNIEGLYKMKRPINLEILENKPVPFEEQLWGNAGVMNTLDVHKAVITQTPSIKDNGQSQSLNTIKIKADGEKKGYLILDGNYYTNNGINIDGDLYVTGSFDFCSAAGANGGDYITGNIYVEDEFHPKGAIRIDGDAYLKGGVNPNANRSDANNLTGGCLGQATGGVVAIGGNTTIENNFFYYNNGQGGGLGFNVAKNLVMTKGQIDLTRTSGNSSDSLAVSGKVCVQNAIKGSIPNTTDAKPKPYFGKTATGSVNIPGPWTSEGSKTFKYNGTPAVANLQIRSDISSANSINTPAAGTCSSTNWKSDGADPMDGSRGQDSKNYKAKIDAIAKDLNKSCQNTPIQFNRSIYDEVKKTTNPAPSNWVHRADKPGSCSVENGKMKLTKTDTWVDLGKELQDCWDAIQNKGTQSTELYQNEWLVVYIRNKVFFNAGNGALTSGKYIIINEIYPSSMADSVCTNRNGNCAAGKCSITDYSNGCPPNELPLPPTAKDVSVMLYLPLGFPNKIVLGGTQIGAGYNYFIFSDYNISNFDTGNKKLRGNIFMNKCSLLNSGLSGSQNPSLNLERHPTLVEELMKNPFKILCENPDPKNPDHCLDGGGGGGGGNNNTELELKDDDYIIPIGPRLKVELESKSLSKKGMSGQSKNPSPSILVMPRVLNLPKDAFKTYPLKSYYNFLYLNKSTPPSSAPALDCAHSKDPSKKISSTATIATVDKLGVYTCTFTDTKISPFYVKIQGETGTPKLTLTADKVQVNSGECTNIHINASNTSDAPMVATLMSMPTGWNINNGTADITIPVGSMETSVKACHVAGAPSSVTITITNTSGNCLPGIPDNTVTIGVESNTYVHRDDATTGTNSHNTSINNLLACPTSGSWSLEYNCTKQQTPTSPHKDSWKCRAGETVTLSPPGDNSCEVVPSNAILSGTATDGKTFTASYKWKQHDLTLSGDLPSVILTPPAGSTATAVTCSRDTKCLLYSGLQYSFTVPPSHVARLDGIDISGNPKVTLTQNNNTLRITTNTNSSTCQYDPFWCNDFYAKGGDVPNYVNKKCFFVKSISQFCSSYSLSKINGVSVGQGNIGCWSNNNTLAKLNINKADGGYYILAGDGDGEIPTFEGDIGKSSLSTCGEKTPTTPSNITCSISGDYFSGTPVPMPAITGCTGTTTPREFLVYNVSTRDYDAGRWGTSDTYTYNNTGDNRAVTLSKITCSGTTYTFANPILCGHISIKPNPYSPWCEISGCYVGNPANVPTTNLKYGCNTGVQGGSSPVFQYTKADNGSIDITGAAWSNGNSQSIATGNNRHVYMYEITCNGTKTINATLGSRSTGAVHCDGSFSVAASQSACPGTTTYNLTCNPINTTVTVGTAITPPLVQCSGTGVPSSDLQWNSYAPNWANPDVGEYTNIGVSATNGNCQGKNATCSGTVKVNPPPCDYNPATFCENTSKANIITSAPSTGQGSNATGKCYFVTSITKIAGGINKINGTTISSGNYCDTGNSLGWGLTECSTALANIPKKDGGYYLYFNGYNNHLTTSNTYGGLSPGCR